MLALSAIQVDLLPPVERRHLGQEQSGPVNELSFQPEHDVLSVGITLDGDVLKRRARAYTGCRGRLESRSMAIRKEVEFV